MPIKTFMINNQEFDIFRSNRNNKKFKVNVNDKIIHFGAKGFYISPGTSKGDSYCARSYGIKGINDINSANFWSRKMWDCKGKKSLR